MKAEYLIIVFFGVALLAFVLSDYQPRVIDEYPNTHSSEWIDIRNPNQLNVLFPGQELHIIAKENNLTELCYPEYTPWSSSKEMVFRDGYCYDFDSNTAGDCNSESDMKISENVIYVINGGKSIPSLSNTFYNQEDFRCSEKTEVNTTDRQYKTVPYATYFICIKTKDNIFHVMITPDKIVYKRELFPTKWKCIDKGEIIAIKANELSDGYHHFSFRGENLYSTYSLYKTNKPYSELYNPNWINIIFPDTEVTPLNRTIYNYFLINSEYTDDINRIWYRCNSGPWQSSTVEENYTKIKLNVSLCLMDNNNRLPHDYTNIDGKIRLNKSFRILYMAESNEINETIKECWIFGDIKRPTLRNVSLHLDTDNYIMSVHGDYNSPEDVDVYLFSEWYVNNKHVTNAKTLDTTQFGIRRGDRINAVTYPIDISGLGGEPVNSSSFIVNISSIPPVAENVRITPETIYPNSDISATGLYKGFDDEGDSEYRWFVNGNYVGTGKKLRLKELELKSGDTVKVEYTPIDSNGLTGSPVINTLIITEDERYYFMHAIEEFNFSFCEKIENSTRAQKCRVGVELGSKECNNRQLREKFFCLAFLNHDSFYCSYIDLDWYKTNCIVLSAGNPEDCLNPDERERDICITEFASSTGNPDLCENIIDPDNNAMCVALANHDTSICSSITDPDLRERCKEQASYA